MYYPIRSAARAAPPWYPHVQLDEDSLILIPQEVKERLARSQQHDDGVVVDMVEIPAGLRQAAAGEEGAGGGGQVDAWGAAPPTLGPPYVGGQGVRPHLLGSAAMGFALAPKAPPRVRVGPALP